MSFANSVAIGPEFFEKARSDYRDQYWAFAREFVQNCLDAPGSTRVDISVVFDAVNNLTVERVQGGLGKGTRKRVFEWGATYTNGAIPNKVVVRINGMPMFISDTECKHGIIVELTGKSTDLLTSNRDGLRHPYYAELESFIT